MIMGERGGGQRHLDGETQREGKIRTDGVNVSIMPAAGIMAEWEGTTGRDE